MTTDVFLDSGILVYAAVGTGKDERKRKRAVELIESADFGTSAQVLQEFFVTVVKRPVRRSRSERFGISYWDAPIVAAAEALPDGGCSVVPVRLERV
jgi:predicted nucleic acid-binding protein